MNINVDIIQEKANKTGENYLIYLSKGGVSPNIIICSDLNFLLDWANRSNAEEFRIIEPQKEEVTTPKQELPCPVALAV